jgi:hypothetical protein
MPSLGLIPASRISKTPSDISISTHRKNDSNLTTHSGPLESRVPKQNKIYPQSTQNGPSDDTIIKNSTGVKGSSTGVYTNATTTHTTKNLLYTGRLHLNASKNSDAVPGLLQASQKGVVSGRPNGVKNITGHNREYIIGDVALASDDSTEQMGAGPYTNKYTSDVENMGFVRMPDKEEVFNYRDTNTLQVCMLSNNAYSIYSRNGGCDIELPINTYTLTENDNSDTLTMKPNPFL